MEEVEESAETACLTKDIKSFKDKYETLLGERGVNLSGGQKQRLAIARAIIKKPKILILDDSLSSVDTETEEKILSGLSNVTKNMTVIIATHRVSSAKNCDKILILENGSIIEFGSHEDLINNNGYYSTSYQKQSS
jgi:ATP-binding cassette subfamily B protein